MPVHQPLTLSTVVTRSVDQVSCDLGGETVLMCIESGMYYAMDFIASRIWALLEQPTSVATLCTQLRQEYNVELAQCEHDVLPFLQQLAAYNLLTVVEATLV